jgi:hypothetical protein
MVAEPARSRSAELIDFGLARSLHSKQISSQSRHGVLVELGGPILRQFETDAVASPYVELRSGSSVERILARAREPERSSVESGAEFDSPVDGTLFRAFGRELRGIEARLDDIDARLVALTETAPRNTVDLEGILCVLAKQIDRSLIETPRVQARPEDGSDARTAGTPNSPASPVAHHVTLGRLQVLLPQMRGRIHATAHLLAKSTKIVLDAKVLAFSNYSLPTGDSLLGPVGKRFGGLLQANPTRALAFGGAVLVLESYILFTAPKSVQMTEKPLVADHMKEWRAPTARAAAAVKAALSPPPVEVKVNSLQTTIALLSPKPISGGASGATSALSGEPPQTTPAAPDPVDTATPVSAAPESDADLLDARATRGDADAQFDYATELYQSGDTKGAISWLEKSAKQGNDKAQLQLGTLYLKGAGVPRNFGHARKWLEMAANNGDTLAMHNLAVLYSGSEGRKPDYSRASDWFRRAAELGVVDSMFNLGLAYADGLGVEKDLIQAYAWFSVAASKGDAKAAQKRKEIGKFLDREELSEGKMLADSLKLAQRDR